MHQHPRPSPRSVSAAGTPSTNPERTNNLRERPPDRIRSSIDLASYTERAGGEAATGEPNRMESAASSSGQDREMTKLNQIIQHFHTKAALMICSARSSLPQVVTKNGDVKQNRWFNIIIDDTNILLDDLQPWKRPDLSESPPPPLVIEMFLDTSQLGPGQALVVMDDDGRRWDVADALSSSAGSSPSSTKTGGRYCEVVLERWTVQLEDARGSAHSELIDQLPNVYKKGVVLFRSLYTFLRFMPAWKLYRRLGRQQPGHNQALRLKYRIRQSRGLAPGQKDSLFTPLYPSDINDNHYTSSTDGPGASSSHLGGVHHYALEVLRLPHHLLRIVVDYRANQHFSWADTEELLSSGFTGLDTGRLALAAGRSLPAEPAQQSRSRLQYGSVAESGVAPREPRSLLGAYGSLSTFHTAEARASPVSALKQRTAQHDHDNEMADRVDHLKTDPYTRYSSLSERYAQRSPFKGGSVKDDSMSSSPNATSLPRPVTPPKPGLSSAGTPIATPLLTAPTRKFIQDCRDQEDELRAIGQPPSKWSRRNSANIQPPPTLRAPAGPIDTGIASSGSSSPRPAPVPHRYSSSFGGRPKRPLSGTPTTGKSADSGGSSARGSTSDQAGGESSGASASKTEDENLQAFITLTLEAPKKVNLARPSPRGHSIDLSKYSNMRDPNMQLAEEMSASSLIQHSSTPPSRRLSNVPALSTSSSPSRALAQHAPYVRSRLSTHSIAEEVPGGAGEGLDSPTMGEVEEEAEEDEEPFIFQNYEA